MSLRAALALALVNAGCGRLGFDPLRGDAQPPGDAFDTNYVFITSSVHSSSALTLDGADAICNARAAEAGLPGTYRAWLSTTTTNAVDRLAGARGWVRLDGKPVVDLPQDIATNGPMYYPILFDETGATYNEGIGHFMTGTNGNGTVSAANCADYTATTGNILSGCANATTGFSSCGNTSCGAMLRLACFGIDHQRPLVIPRTTGRLAFVSTGVFSSGAGIAPADALCQNAAMAAGVPGVFAALLATSNASAASRVSAMGPTWVRRDGVALAATAADFLAGRSDVPLNQQIDDKYVVGNFIFTGAAAIDATATDATNCADWTLVDVGSTATFGAGNKIQPRGFADPALGGNCTFDTLVYCLER